MNNYVDDLHINVNHFLGNPVIRKLPGCMKNWSNEKKREWLCSEIDEFLKVYVLTQTSDEEIEAFVSHVNELEIHQRNGYPCRDCGMIFKYHSVRVEYVTID